MFSFYLLQPISTMTLRGEILTHLGKDDIKNVIDHPSLSKSFKFARAIAFPLFLFLYCIFFNFLSHFLYFFKIIIPSTKTVFDFYITQSFWTFCIYFLEINNVKINLMGDDLENDNALIMSNHKSIVDHIIFPYLTRNTLKESGISSAVISSDSENEDFETIKYNTKASNNKNKKRKQKPKPKQIKEPNNKQQMNNLKIKILNNEKNFFAKDLSIMMIPTIKFFTWFNIWNMPTIEYLKDISQSDENWELDGETLISIFQKFLDQSTTMNLQWLVIFPEVNIFSEKDLKLQNILGEKHYLPTFENVLYPRFGGFANAIGGLYKTKFTRLYDITIIYYNKDLRNGKVINFNPPSLLNILGLRNRNIETTILVYVKAKFLSRVPLKRNRLEKYLENRWIKKDKLISKLQGKILKENEMLLNYEKT